MITKKEYLEAIESTAEALIVFRDENCIDDWLKSNNFLDKSWEALAKLVYNFLKSSICGALQSLFDLLSLPLFAPDYFYFFSADILENALRDCSSLESFKDCVLEFCGGYKDHFLHICEDIDYEFYLLSLTEECWPTGYWLLTKGSEISKGADPFFGNDKKILSYLCALPNLPSSPEEGDSNFADAFETVKGDLISEVLKCTLGQTRIIGNILGFLPSVFREDRIKKHILEEEENVYESIIQSNAALSLYFSLFKDISRLGEAYLQQHLHCMALFLLDCSETSPDRPAWSKHKTRYLISHQSSLSPFEQDSLALPPEKTLLIFDFDHGIFDIDYLRESRKNFAPDEACLAKTRYVPGFEKAFLEKESPLYLKRFKVLGLMPESDECASALLDSHPEFSQFLTYTLRGRDNTVMRLKSFLEAHKEDFEFVIGFGEAETDACIYSRLGINFYIVNKFYGYDVDPKNVIQAIRSSQRLDFRRHYLHDKKTIGYSYYQFDKFDEIVVYYKNYLDTFRYDYWGGSRGSCYAPEQGSVKPLKVYSASTELGKSHKSQYILDHLDAFSGLFDDLPLDDWAILTCVPAHDELVIDKEKPMYKLLKAIAEKHSIELPPDGVLYRTKEVSESKNGDRNIDKHLESIAITETGKEAIRGKTVYLFDDIVTSGSSMMACSKILYDAGAGHVVCLCIARTCGDGKFAPVEIE